MSVAVAQIARPLLAALALCCAGAVAGQSYPSKAVKVIVPFSPGSASDILARVVGQRLTAGLGQPFVIENRPGAGGTIGTAQAAKAAADGYTLVVVSAGHVVSPVFYSNLPYDPLKDLSGVIPLGSLPSVLIVPRSLEVNSLRDLTALAKSKPGQLNYVSAGVGSASYVNAEKYRLAASIDAVHVPLKGAGDMVGEIMGDRAHFGFAPILSAVSALKDGKVVTLAISSSRRSAILPNVPTMAEAGVPGGEFNFWIGLLAPSKTPRDVVRRLNDEVTKILEMPDVQKRLAALGAQPFFKTPEAFDAFMREEYVALGSVMKAARANNKK